MGPETVKKNHHPEKLHILRMGYIIEEAKSKKSADIAEEEEHPLRITRLKSLQRREGREALNGPRGKGDKKRKLIQSFECNICQRKFPRKTMLVYHMNSHKYECPEAACKETFKLKKVLKRHIEKIHGPSLYSCSVCEYKSNNKCTLNDHFVRKHTSNFEFPCTLCSKQFKIKNSLKQHMNQMHGDNPPIVCTICGHSCKNVPAIKAHIKYRHFQPAYKCMLCKRGLTTKENLEQHLIWHERKEKVVCPTCGKTFGEKRDLDMHLRIHLGIRPYSCPVCSKTFTRKTGLEQHLLIHTGKKPYTCDICSHTFAQKPGLICHRKKHPGPLPPLPVISIKNIVNEFTQEMANRKDISD